MFDRLTGTRWRVAAGLVVLVLLGFVTTPGRQALAMVGGLPKFLGAGPGSPIAYALLDLPPVVVGPYNDPRPLLDSPFTPSFEDLVLGETIIENEAQFRHVWRRLFDAPYDASAVDFESDFVILVGGGLMHPDFGFSVTDVEAFESEFSALVEFDENPLEPGLAVLVVTELPGVEPPKADPIYRLSAVVVDRDLTGDVIVNRQTLALAFP
jgi:hypothetical protein